MAGEPLWSGTRVPEPPRHLLRKAIAVLLACAASWTGAWWLSGDFSAPWLLVPVVVVPSLIATAWASTHESLTARLTMGTASLVLCGLTAWIAWTPEPPLFGALRSRETEATNAAEQALATQSPGTCSPPAAIDVGPLAHLGPWQKVCVYGTQDRKHGGVQFFRPTGEVVLEYTVTHPIDPDSCVRRVTGNWWAYKRPDFQDSGNACPRQYTFQGGG